MKFKIYVLLASLTALSGFHALADYEDGVSAVMTGDYVTAFAEFSTSAREGLDMAQYNLGILYFTGRGTEPDPEQAFYWTEKAAVQGHTAAQFNLAALYYEGQGVEQDKAQAFEWYRAAAVGEHPDARYTVSRMYFEADGVEKDLVHAHAWARLAIESEVSDATELLERIERSLSPAQLSEARRVFARIKIGLE